MAITQQQLDDIRKQLDLIKKTASTMSEDEIAKVDLSGMQKQISSLSGKTLPAATPKTVPTATPSPKERASGLQSFSTALQEAVNLGRTQRQNAELDFLGGVIPKGAVSASQFTGLLANLNKASSDYTTPLVDTALDFAKSDETARQETMSSIRDLALSVVEAGGSQEVVRGILNAGDIDSAIGMAAGALNKDGKLVVEKVGSNLVQYDPRDPEGTVRTLFSAGGGSSTSDTTSPGFGNFDFFDAKIADVKVEAKKMFAPDVANQIISELTDEQLRLFINDYAQESSSQQMSIDVMPYYTQWKEAAGLGEESSTGGEAVTNRFRKT